MHDVCVCVNICEGGVVKDHSIYTHPVLVSPNPSNSLFSFKVLNHGGFNMTLRLCLEQSLCGRVIGESWMRCSPALETKMLCESLVLPLCNLPIAIPLEMDIYLV